MIKSLLKHLFWRLDSSSSLSHPFMTGAPIPYHVCSLLLISSMSVFILNWGTQDWTQGSRCSVSAEQKHFPPPAGNAFPGAAQKAVELRCCLGCITDLAWTWWLPGYPRSFWKKREGIDSIVTSSELTLVSFILPAWLRTLAMGIELFLDNFRWSWNKIYCSYCYTAKPYGGDNKCYHS